MHNTLMLSIFRYVETLAVVSLFVPHVLLTSKKFLNGGEDEKFFEQSF